MQMKYLVGYATWGKYSVFSHMESCSEIRRSLGADRPGSKGVGSYARSVSSSAKGQSDFRKCAGERSMAWLGAGCWRGEKRTLYARPRRIAALSRVSGSGVTRWGWI